MSVLVLTAFLAAAPALAMETAEPLAGAELAAITTAAVHDEEDPGLVERLWPMGLHEDLDPLVASGVWSFWIGGFIPFVPGGHIWLPLVVIDAPIDMGQYLVDAILITLVHLAPHLLAIPAAFVLIFGGAAIAAATAPQPGGLNLPIFFGGFAGGFGLLGLNGLCLGANVLWCIPVATANAFDRAVATERGKFRRRADNTVPTPLSDDLAMAF